MGGLLLCPARLLAEPALPRLSARHAFVGNLDDTLLAIDADKPVAIASITKLVTALVLLQAELPFGERITIAQEDVVSTAHLRSNLPPGSTWTREQLLEWMLVTSDNRAAVALARTYPGGWPGFQYAMRALMTQMNLFSFDFGDAFGLSATNRASARDLGVLLTLLTLQPWFSDLASRRTVAGHPNTNRFAHDRSVELLAGKTGFTSAAGHCLAQTEKFGGRVYALVVLNAQGRDARARDMQALRDFTRARVG
jgi:D-alanyl-D-alanine carboxypeptidase